MQSALFIFLMLGATSLFGVGNPNCESALKKLSSPKKLYRPLLSTNTEALLTTKINTTFPSPNMYAPTPDKWLAPDSEYRTQMDLRKALYGKRPTDILKIQPGQEERVREAAQEFLEMTGNHLTTQFPADFVREGDNIRAIKTGVTVSLDAKSGPHPLEKLGMLIQDDVTINLKDSEGKVILAGGFLATPTNWSLQDFIGMDVHAIHAGIPEYENRLKKTVEGSVERGVKGKCIGRNNWFLVTNPELALPSYRRSTYREPSITEQNVGKNVFLRSELESIVNLPKTGATIFTIRPRVWDMAFV
ncbi:MAG: heme-dependent oxidative N-demethylase family protein, partial [Deltaproteobacteria bacterium]